MDVEEFKKRIEQDLAEWEARMDILRAKADKAREENSPVDLYETRLSELSAKKDAARQRFEECLERGDESFRQMAEELEGLVEEFKKKVDNALAELTNVEPLEIEERKKKK
ncbi:MAG: hypothetical protein R6V10_13940 [bacterium]